MFTSHTFIQHAVLSWCCLRALQSHVMASQLQQLAALPQLTSLELRDSCSWALPCPGLSNISCLTQLQQLQVLVQSPGGWPAVRVYGVEGPNHNSGGLPC